MAADKVEADEARRIAQHERIKEKLEADVHSGIAREAEAQRAEDRARYGSVAADLKRKAADEVVETESEIDRARTAARVSQVIDYADAVLPRGARRVRDSPPGDQEAAPDVHRAPGGSLAAGGGHAARGPGSAVASRLPLHR